MYAMYASVVYLFRQIMCRCLLFLTKLIEGELKSVAPQELCSFLKNYIELSNKILHTNYPIIST